MDLVSELLETYEQAPSLAEAERALDAIAAETPPPELELGELYDGLAEVAAEEGEYALAVRAQKKALEQGCEHPELAREMLGWYLLKAGEDAAGEALFEELRRERPDDSDLLILIGNARSDAGSEDEALAAFDEALELAKRQGAQHAIDRARGERRESRRELGLASDEDDRLAPRPNLAFGETTRWSLAWFPRDQRDAALARWPDLDDDLHDADAYCRRIERELRDLQNATGRRPSVAMIRVEEFVAYAERESLPAGEGSTRSRFAAELDRSGDAFAWPPGRNEACWCGSGRKYKRCCAMA